MHIHIGPIGFAKGSFGATYLTTASPSGCQFTEECPPLDATIATNFWDPNNAGGRGRTVGKWIKVSQPGSPRYIMKYEDRSDITQVTDLLRLLAQCAAGSAVSPTQSEWR